MNLPEDTPATTTQILHDETQHSKSNAATIESNNHTNENTASFKEFTAPSTTKNKKQSSISDLVMLTKGKMRVSTTITNTKDKMALAKTQPVTTT